MKKFTFQLDSVLHYKEQLLDNVREEYAQAQSRARKQERAWKEALGKYQGCREELEEKKRQGMTVSLLREYEAYLDHLGRQAQAEERGLERLRQQEAKVRRELVAVKQEKATIEKLREKKLEQHHKEASKKEEKFIEEFVTNVRLAKSHE